MRIGVLALQGAFREHVDMLKNMNIKTLEVRTKADLDVIDGLILPGGESTVIGKLLDKLELKQAIKERIKGGMPVWGTCAGMILLSSNHDHLGVMDIDVKRNAYGNQSGSFMCEKYIACLEKEYQMVFIRAPYIEKIDVDVEMLVEVNGDIVGARQGHMLATSFHPEVTGDSKFHEYFLEMVQNR